MARSIRVLSANLWWENSEIDGVVELIQRHRIDVLAVQELSAEAAEAISAELPYGQLEPHARGDDFLGMGIALRQPAAYEQIPLHFRPARRVVLDPAEWEGLARPFELVNVHIHAPHSIRPFPSFLVRHRQMNDFERFIDKEPSDARVVVGDFNATPLWSVYRRMARRFSDGAVLCAEREGRPVEPTWGPSPRSPRLLRIDHAMVRGLELDTFQVIDIPGSDHSGLLFDCYPSD